MKKHALLFAVLFLGAWAVASAQTFNVVFQVDMTVQIAKGAFDPAADKVQARGDFNNWGTTDMAPISAGSKVYSATIAAAAGTAKYKFFFKHGANDVWESDQATSSKNREFNVTADATVPVVLFNNEVMPSGNPVGVNFTADMKTAFRKNALDPVTGKVYVAGDFNGWDKAQGQLTGPAADSTYTATFQINSAQLLHYKFLYDNKTGGTTWEDDPNKTAWVTDDPTQNVVKRFFNDVDPSLKFADGAINFQVDMSTMYELHFYDPATDSLRVRGAFNGWGDSDHSKAFMNQDPISPNNFFISIPFVQEKVGQEEFYKFRMQMKTEYGAFTGDAQYERPLSTGGGNRTIVFAGIPNQYTEPTSFYYDDIYSAFVVPNGQQITVNFAVDMTNAMDPALQAIPFDPATDTVFVFNGQAAWAQAMGWTEGMDRCIKLAKSTGNIYTGSVVVKSPGFNGFTYAYEYGHAADGSLQKEGTGFSNWSWRVRYVPMTSSRHFVQPYTAKVDHWTKAEVKANTEYETWPDGLSAVEDLGKGVPTTFNLDQNYPNPFNPSTKIKFNLPSEQMVSLKVYNVLGQEVTTLVDQQMKAGSYSFDFDASKLSSGVYFYRIQAGTFSMTKKMMLIK